MRHTVLMVDDDTSFLMFVREFLETHGFNVRTATSGAEALRLVHAEPKLFSAVIVDYQMKELNGAATTKGLLAINARLPIVIYSGDASRDAVLLSARSGAFTFVDKSEGVTVFLEEVQRAVLRHESEKLLDLEPQESDDSIPGMVGNSPKLKVIARTVAKLRDKPGPVLILGESGTGKELIARALHGQRRGQFRALNCADFLMSAGTSRSELFGHVRGAFTGADQDKAGIFEQAKQGTVFLDELYSLPPEAQVGLLRVLQEKRVIRMGGNAEIALDTRVLAAAKPDLVQDIARKSFKADLFYRLSQNIIEVPPLRERLEDIPALVDHFCKKWSKENGEQKTFTMGAVERLKNYSWPGNIRELENVVYSVLNVSEQVAIHESELGIRFKSASDSVRKQNVLEAEKNELAELLKSSISVRDAAHKIGVAPSTILRRLERAGLDWKDLVAKGRRVGR